MPNKTLFIFLIGIFLVFPVLAFAAGEKPPVTYKEIPEVQFVRPQKPLSIKLKRQVSGEYTWEISGSNVEEILDADKKLRKVLMQETDQEEE
ncbi:MAG TPA: hypothetical protein VJL89_08730 [Thermodesulfovibrionia bacterium]|nr:hypothetical protein [Thermodesulfovibrionia bacterium]